MMWVVLPLKNALVAAVELEEVAEKLNVHLKYARVRNFHLEGADLSGRLPVLRYAYRTLEPKFPTATPPLTNAVASMRSLPASRWGGTRWAGDG